MEANMRFGEYLVEAGVVSEADVLTALAGQQRRQPFVPQLAVELGLITPQEAFRLLNLADQQNREFLEVALDEGLLGEDDLDRLTVAEQQSVPQLGTLLLAMDRLEPRTLHRHLNEFRRRYPDRVHANRRGNSPAPVRERAHH
jgi:hypothetical protein